MAARKSSLRVVDPDERAVAAPKTIVEAAENGDRLGELRLMRVRLAKALDDPNCPPRDMAALSRRQLEIGREIDAIVARESEENDSAEVADGVFDASAV